MGQQKAFASRPECERRRARRMGPRVSFQDVGEKNTVDKRIACV